MRKKKRIFRFLFDLIIYAIYVKYIYIYIREKLSFCFIFPFLVLKPKQKATTLKNVIFINYSEFYTYKLDVHTHYENIVYVMFCNFLFLYIFC